MRCIRYLEKDIPVFAAGHGDPSRDGAAGSFRFCRPADQSRRVCELDVLVARRLGGCGSTELRPGHDLPDGRLVQGTQRRERDPWAINVGLLLHCLRHFLSVRLLLPSTAGHGSLPKCHPAENLG